MCGWIGNGILAAGPSRLTIRRKATADIGAPRSLMKTYRPGFCSRWRRRKARSSKRMAELGYQEGRNFTFEYIQTPSIAGYELTYRELAARNVDILLAAGNEPALR